MLTLFRSFFFPSVDQILGKFYKVVDKLQKAIDFHQAKAVFHSGEVEKAKSVSGKLRALLS